LAELDGTVVAEVDAERSVGGVDVGDRAALAVEVAGVVVVADDDDMVADGEGAVGVPGDFVGAEVALRFAEFAGAEVEVGDVGAAVGEHDRVAIGTGPVVDERLSCLFGGVGDGDPPVFAVGAGEAFDLARAELLKGFAVPRVLLTAAFAQLDGWGLNGEDVEGAAGGDLGELAVVADEDELALRGVGGVGEAGEVAGADHAGLVDDQHGVAGEVVAFVEVTGQPGDRRGRIPAWSSSSSAARADSAHPMTCMPDCSHASRAASSANVLPVPAGARTTCTPSRPRVR
jgi:hypothetical protein